MADKKRGALTTDRIIDIDELLRLLKIAKNDKERIDRMISEEQGDLGDETAKGLKRAKKA
jgi:hypothetical protein